MLGIEDGELLFLYLRVVVIGLNQSLYLAFAKAHVLFVFSVLGSFVEGAEAVDFVLVNRLHFLACIVQRFLHFAQARHFQHRRIILVGFESSASLLAHHFHLLVVREQLFPRAHLFVVVEHHIFLQMQLAVIRIFRWNKHVLGGIRSVAFLIRRQIGVVLQLVGGIDDGCCVVLNLVPVKSSLVDILQQGVTLTYEIRHHFVLNMVLGIDELRTEAFAINVAVEIADVVACRVSGVTSDVHTAGIGEHIVRGLADKHIASGTLRAGSGAHCLRQGIRLNLRFRPGFIAQIRTIDRYTTCFLHKHD